MYIFNDTIHVTTVCHEWKPFIAVTYVRVMNDGKKTFNRYILVQIVPINSCQEVTSKKIEEQESCVWISCGLYMS